MKPATKFALVLVTAPDLKTARSLAKTALQAKLIACANLVPKVESHYWWQGRLESGEEVLLILKTSRTRLAALEKLMTERAMVNADELAAGHMRVAAVPVQRVLQAQDVAAMLARGSPTARQATGAPRFNLGDTVRTAAGPFDHHTRLPAYAHGRIGTIERWHGAHVFADANAQGLGELPQHLYSVVFDGAVLWGSDAAPGLRVSIDAWESYLEHA